MSRRDSSSRSSQNSIIEPLEGRRLLSADLTGVFANQLPDVLKPSDTNHADLRVINDGDAKARGPVTVDLFASPVSDGASDDIVLGSITRNLNLNPGRGSLLNFRFAEPMNAADGSYSLMAQINGQSMLNADSANDIVVAPAPMTFRQPYVDLAAQNVKAPTQPILIEGNFVTTQPASVTVANRGTAGANENVSVNFYLSKDTTLDGTDILSGTLPYEHVVLRPGQSETFKTPISAPINTPAGNYYLFADVTPMAGIVQKNPGDEVGLAARQVTVVQVAAPVLQGMPQPATYTGPTIEATPGSVGIIAVNCNPPAAPSTSPSNCSPGSDCSNSAADSSDQQSGCNPQQGDTTQPSDDNCQGSTDDQSDQSGQDDSSNSSTDDSSDSSNDGSNGTSSDDSSDTSTDTSGDTSTDDSGDTSTDNSGDTSSDDSGDTSSDDSGDDMSDDILRRSATESLPKLNTAIHHAASTLSHASGYKSVGQIRHTISGGHR